MNIMNNYTYVYTTDKVQQAEAYISERPRTDWVKGGWSQGGSLQWRVYDSLPMSDVRVVLGDFNAQIGKEQSRRKDVDKITWNSNDKKPRSQIDHVLTDKTYSANILNVRSYRVTLHDSDHALVRGYVQVQVAPEKRMEEKWAFKVQFT